MGLQDILITVTFGLLAGLTMKTNKSSEAEKMYNEMHDIIKYLDTHNIEIETKDKIRDFYSYSWNLKRS